MDIGWSNREHHQQPHSTAKSESHRTPLGVSLRGQKNGSARRGQRARRACGFDWTVDAAQRVDADANYAMAYSGLADSYALLAGHTNESPRRLMPKAKEAALKALALDDKLAEAHASLGQITLYYDYDFATAEREYRRAIELNPNYATAHQWLAEHLSEMKRQDEALAEIKRALELDPLSIIMNRIYGDILVNGRRFDETVEQHKKTLELDPNFPTAHFFLGRAYEGKVCTMRQSPHTRLPPISRISRPKF